MSERQTNGYNPDVLTCLANLSNDEVFTSPELANRMLDSLPAGLWSSPNTKILDPVCKSSVFLREAAKRLNRGLAAQIPDLQTRLNHIFTHQLYGIAITELTALLSRRSIYCSKQANSPQSVCTAFADAAGNILHGRIPHRWGSGKKGSRKCLDCGAGEEQYGRPDELENHAYAFIHPEHNPFLAEIGNMNFDVIIGNPPYQLSDGGAQASASPIYHKFVQQAKKLEPRYLVMIIPSRWFAGGKGLDEFRDEMLNDRRLREIHDFPNSSDCFTGVEIKGGINYFLWDSKKTDPNCLICTYEDQQMISKASRPLKEENIDIFIRNNEAISILQKVLSRNERSFSEIISSRKPFGLTTETKGNPSPYVDVQNILLYQNKGTAYLKRGIIQTNSAWINQHKVLVPYAIDSGDSKTDQVKPIYAGPNTACTETYLVIGPFPNKAICENVMSYIDTRFFHFMLTLKKNTQHTTKKVYQFVPMQNFSKPWTDEELYAKYGLTTEEIGFIEKMVRPMDGA
ncbi:type II restriction m6 adenine DNA methyltransferase, Alw26I/Eco31I/Esp3I family [Helicobacter pametensis]|nr:type II restriction m6 adenine DNA methyltransferase, Alw26I/Eco31I/Esp3I family [Helicobacter pametensis]